MKNTILTATAVVLAALNCRGFDFEFAGILPDMKSKTEMLDFRLYTTNLSERPLWGRNIKVTTDAEGMFKVIIADNAGTALDAQFANLEDAIAKVGDDTMQMKVSDSKSATFAVKMPPAQIAGVAEEAMSAAGDFNASKGMKVNAQFKGTDFLANRLVATTLTCDTDAKCPNGARISGNLTASGGVLSQGLTTVADAVRVATNATVAAIEAKNGVVAQKLSEVKSIAAGSKFTVGGVNAGVPAGTIVLWSGTEAPKGWHICNGSDNTPDLRDKFVVGAGGKYAKGAYGGANSVQLSIDQMPSHIHSVPYRIAKYGCASIEKEEIRGIYRGPEKQRETNAAGSPSGGVGGAHENRPPYYALMYIMKMGGAK